MAHYCGCILDLSVFFGSYENAEPGKGAEDVTLRAGGGHRLCKSDRRELYIHILGFGLVTVPAAHLLLSKEGCMGLRPPGSADGERQVNP